MATLKNTARKTTDNTGHVDVLIIGAGISGIGAGYYLTKKCPGKSFTILERRSRIGGTWDLFRYPGIRSDSDMFTFGFAFKPWMNPKMISDGESIRGYLEETAREFGIDKHIQFGIRVVRAGWSSAEGKWTVEARREDTGENLRFTCNFLIGGTGYYDYDEGFTPDFPGRNRYKGKVVHPQHWPEDLDYTGKRIVVIGSGATAITLIPNLAAKAKHVTMLQRSPTYVMNLPERDPITNALRPLLPKKVLYGLIRSRNVSMQLLMFRISRARPEVIRKFLLGQLRKQLGPNFDLKHFSPKYNPWEERLCVVPDGDMFKVLRSGKASVNTDEIETFTERGIQLKSGLELEADIIITATGLNMKLLGGMTLEVDGKPYDVAGRYAYKALMFEDLPNFAMLFGYPNMSWTMKVDISCDYIARLLNYMDKNGLSQVTPRNKDRSLTPLPFMDLKSGYVRRALDQMPKQGSKFPWRLYNNYWLDLATLRFTRLDDGKLEFSRAQAPQRVS
jgi:cation diffusion facilitator CzcD-associated flavoprotein CzcO